MIVGTAGHIDHGKSTLVAALTGADPDRLPEEKRRGITIEAGYAWLEVPGGDGRRIGFVDVPGHERLVRTMIAGASGIDFALMLVAADDGPMPQTREHLAVLSLLGLRRGAVAVTKCDLVEPARVQQVCAQVRALLRATPLQDVPILPVSAHTGEGIDALRALLYAAAAEPVALAANRAFRLAIDRVFVLGGTGVVAAGTIHAGSVRPGDELAIAPSERGLRVRVRGLHVHDRRTDEARAGQRCALALAGVERGDIGHGLWLVDPAVALSTHRIDLRLALWRDEEKALRSGTRVHVHAGACDTVGSVVLLDGDALEVGASARAQLVLQEPIAIWHGDRVVLRDASASRTIAGGSVLDPFAPARYRRTVQRLAVLDACERDGAAQRLAALLSVSSHGVDLAAWARAEGIPASALPEPAQKWLRAREAGHDWVLGEAQASEIGEAALAALHEHHRREPDEIGPDAARLRRTCAPRLPAPLWSALLGRLADEARVQLRGPFVHLPEHAVRLSESESRIAKKIAPLLEAAGFNGSWVRDLSRETRESEALMRTTLARMARRGDLHQVVKDLYFDVQTMQRLAAIARTEAERGDGGVTAARFRDATGLGRKRAIQILEHFDRIGFLRRIGDLHRLRTDTALFATAPADAERTT
ncbi:MAG TPA: selenocysteine-specific translation elongation factor [Burkholderiaceae bacterium]|nr:selenocysteine-specific translation elongation factor [Burkholderiaceae bacterium]